MNFKNLLYLSKSEEQFYLDISRAIHDNKAFKLNNNQELSEILKYYFGYDDGKCADRVLELINS